MKNKAKFMLIGAVMTGMFSLAHAESNKTVSESQIKESIHHILKKQVEKGFFTEKSDVSIKIKKSTGTEEVDQRENILERIGNMCKMQLSFDSKGDITFLGKDEEIRIVTQFQNERQKDLARQFVALHEQSHCEFTSISNPVQIKGADKKFEEKMNQDLKNLDVLNLGFESNKLSYINTLGESYADVSAMMAMIKEYGANDKDLQFVLKSISTQRHESYISVGAEDHDTHVAIRKLLTKDNIDKLEKINNQEEFRGLALNIANEGVQTLLTQRPDFAKESFTKENLDISIIINIIRVIKSEIEGKNASSPTIFKNGVESGLAFNIAKELLKDVNYSKHNFDETKNIDGKINKGAYAFAIERFQKGSFGKYQENYNNFKDDMKAFVEIISKNNMNETVDFDNKTTKEEIMKKVQTLRSQFLESMKTNTMSLKM